MKLISCYIEGYGCLKQKEISFDGELTQVLAHNGDGKTTLASFLKAMLYGLKSYRKGSVEFCDREHFYPFDGGKFGGNLRFVWQGKQYKIERFFGAKSETDDTLIVYEDGDVTTKLGVEIGKTVLGLDRESFERTLFLASGDVESSSTSCINAAFVGVAAQGDAQGVQNALNALDKAAKTYKKSKAGRDKITALKEEIALVEKKIDAARALRGTLSGKYQRLQALRKDIQTLSAQQTAAQQQSTWNEQWSHYQDLMAQATRKEWDYNALLAKYPFGLPTMEEAYAAREAKREIDRYADAKRTEQTAGGRIRLSWVCGGAAGVFAVVGVICLLCVLVAVGLVFVALAAIAAAFCVALCRRERAMEAASSSAATEREKRRETAAETVAQFEKRYGVFVAAVEWIIDDIRMAAMLFGDVEVARNNAARYHQEKQLGGKPLDVAIDGQNIGEQLDALRREEAALARDIDECERESEPLEEYENEKTALQEELKECQRKHRLLLAAAEYLARSERQLNERYVRPILDEFLHYARLLEDVLGEKVTITREFELRFERNGEERSERHFSAGQRSLCALCFRLALVKNMYSAKGRELPFMVLDDPFASLDEEHMQRAKKLLNGLSEELQIVYFTCHASRSVKE